MARIHPTILIGILSVTLAQGCLTVDLPEVRIEPSQEGRVLTWEDAVTQTLRDNPELSSARFGVVSKARSRDIAVGNFLPSVSGNLQKDRLRTTGSGPMSDNLSLSITGEQPLFTGFDNTGKFMKARRELEATRWTYQTVSATTRFQLRSVYVELLRLERLLEVDQRIAERRKQNSELIRLRYEGGRENLGSSMRAEAIAQRAAYAVRVIKRRIESQSILMSREIGGEFTFPVRVEGDLEKMQPQVLSATPDYPRYAVKTPRVQRLVKIAEAYKAEIVSAQSVVWPQVDGTLDYGYTGDRARNLRDQLDLALKVSMPFFNGGQNIEGILKAKADYNEALEAAESARNDMIAQLADAWTQLKDAVENVDVQRQLLESARKRAEIIRAEYTTGLVNYQDFDITEQDLADSENTYVQSLADVLTKEANWEYVKGATLEDVLDEK